MNEPLNPYQAWLGIPPEECDGGRPHHYQLLGVRVFEKDTEAIDAGARRTIAKLSLHAMGPQHSLVERLMLEVGAAVACLRDPAQNAQYDRALASGEPLAAPAVQEQTYARAQPVATASMGGTPDAAAVDYVTGLMDSANSTVADDSILEPLEQPACSAEFVAAPMRSWPIRRMRQQGLSLPAIMAVLGGVVGLTGGYFIMYYVLGEDLLQLLPPREALLRLRD